ncbi:MAG TPA: OsmC family protein [Gemmatimonadaceae bacterium]|nr:OsmC family protein [Gemmatimonadaceae bacterium]
MKFTLLSDDAIRLEQSPGPMTIEAASEDQVYSPFHMIGSALASCTLSVLHSWATHARVGADDLAVEVRWTFADDPHRVDRLAVTLDWPSLPPARLATARRVVELCTVHATLQHAPTITVAHDTDREGVAPASTGATHPV